MPPVTPPRPVTADLGAHPTLTTPMVWQPRYVVGAPDFQAQIAGNIAALAQPPAFIASAANLSLPAATATPVVMTASFDPYTMVGGTAITIPFGCDGVYEIKATLGYPNTIASGTNINAAIYQNGANVQQVGMNKGVNSNTVNVMARILCAAGDVINVKAYQGGTTTQTAGGGRISGRLIYWDAGES